MSDGRYKRLRQYAKVFKYCHKRLNSQHVKTRYEHDILFYVETRAMVSVFNNSCGKPAELKGILESIKG